MFVVVKGIMMHVTLDIFLEWYLRLVLFIEGLVKCRIVSGE